jgi:hypothetical protein
MNGVCEREGIWGAYSYQVFSDTFLIPKFLKHPTVNTGVGACQQDVSHNRIYRPI